MEETISTQQSEQGRGITLLLVEDDADLADLLRAELESKGFTVLYASNGAEANAYLDDLVTMQKVSIILLDLLLPDARGFDILKTIKQNSSIASIPVLILSNLGASNEIAEGKNLGAAGYLIKANFSLNDIAQEVTKTIENSK